MRNCLTNTKGLVKIEMQINSTKSDSEIEMQINSTKSDSDFSVVHIYSKLQEKISFLLNLDIKDMQKRYIPEKPRFYRGFSRLRGVKIFVTKYGCKTDVFPFLTDPNFRITTE